MRGLRRIAGGGRGDFSAALGYAKEQHEKATADVDSIIKLKTELEMEFVMALYTAFHTERKLEEVSTSIGSTSPSSHLYFQMMMMMMKI